MRRGLGKERHIPVALSLLRPGSMAPAEHIDRGPDERPRSRAAGSPVYEEQAAQLRIPRPQAIAIPSAAFCAQPPRVPCEGADREPCHQLGGRTGSVQRRGAGRHRPSLVSQPAHT